MIGFLARRLAAGILVMLAVAVLAFLMFRYVGDPVAQMTGVETARADQERLRGELGLDDPVLVQFGRFVGGLVQGDLGYSYRTRQPVGAMLLERAPATIELGLVALAISLVLAVPGGIYAALRPRSVATQAILIGTLIGVSVPTFVIGILLIFVFGVELGWLPTFGRGGTLEIGGWRTSLLTPDGWRFLILPAVTLGLYQLTLTLRLVRAEMTSVLRTDHIRFAIARGLPMRQIYVRHALGNTLVPVVTVVALQFGGVIAFSIVTESVFQWPGLGLLFLESIRFVDIPVMAVYLVVIGAVFVVMNLLVDLLYVALDPRIRLQGGA